ncbi:hypothetical protein JI435_414910, partial [Parastagonospora nodorum SN15]
YQAHIIFMYPCLLSGRARKDWTGVFTWITWDGMESWIFRVFFVRISLSDQTATPFLPFPCVYQFHISFPCVPMLQIRTIDWVDPAPDPLFSLVHSRASQTALL